MASIATGGNGVGAAGDGAWVPSKHYRQPSRSHEREADSSPMAFAQSAAQSGRMRRDKSAKGAALLGFGDDADVWPARKRG